ncbi:MAG: hypothetical protein Q9160_002218 [Pyrenula sp. 1 TL-2023]
MYYLFINPLTLCSHRSGFFSLYARHTSLKACLVAACLTSLITLSLLYRHSVFTLRASSFGGLPTSDIGLLDFLGSDSISVQPSDSHSHTPKYAFATFLTGTSANVTDKDDNHDNYLVATRILIYQLLHAPETRSKTKIPIVALVTKEVPESKRARLRKDGAIVKEVRHVHGAGWEDATSPNWADVLTKLRLWELVEYDRVAFLDGDTILTKPIDGVFDDPAVAQLTTSSNPAATHPDEAPLPSKYSFAAITQLATAHSYPPTIENHSFPNPDYLNAGLMVLQPSLDLFAYYLSLTKVPRDRFNHDLPEQNLLNYAHRRDGNMPWQALDPAWNVQYPSLKDVEGGAASLHDKWWDERAQPGLWALYRGWRMRMMGFNRFREREHEGD